MTVDNILRERWLHWLGHVFRMDHQRIPQQELYWQVPGYKRGPGRPRANWRGVVSKELRKMGFTWEEAEVAALDRHGWRRSVAQCVQLDTGWIKVKVCFCDYCVQDEKYDHIELADMEKVKNAVLEKHQWLETNAGLCNQQPVYVDPPVTVTQINAQQEVSLYFITGNLFAVF